MTSDTIAMPMPGASAKSGANGASLDSSTFEYIRKLVLERSSISLESTKGYLVESRLSPLARKCGFSGVADLALELRRTTHGELHERVVDAMTTNETSFFRDLHPFETLQRHVLPEIISRRQQRRALHIWSAACSSGQEPYTIAMVLREQFPQLAGWKINIHATDLSREMVERASAGCYSQAEVNRGLPASSLVKHFQRQGLNWVVKPELRGAIEFSQLNLTHSWSRLPAMDVIFMRNVLIYFTPDTKRQILQKAHRQLSDGGVLFLGGAETTLGLHEHFERVVLGKSTIYRPTSAASARL